MAQYECEMEHGGADEAGDSAREEDTVRTLYFMPQPQQTGCRID